jgi:hypothetical protein
MKYSENNKGVDSAVSLFCITILVCAVVSIIAITVKLVTWLFC